MICRGLIINFIFFFAKGGGHAWFYIGFRHCLLYSKVKFFLLKNYNQPIFLNFFVKIDATMILVFWVVFFVFNFSSCAHK